MELTNDFDNSIIKNEEKNTLQVDDHGSLPGNYHVDELRIHNRINNTAIGIIIAGFAIIFFSFLYMIITGDIEIGKITTFAGVITECISGILFWYVTKSSNDKWKYFNVLNQNEEQKILLKEIRNSTNAKFKEKMLEKLVDKHCKNDN